MISVEVHNKEKKNCVQGDKVIIRLGHNNQAICAAIEINSNEILLHRVGEPEFENVLKYLEEPLKIKVVNIPSVGDSNIYNNLNKIK